MKQIEDMTIVAATKNQHKIREIEAITQKYGMKIVSRDEAGIPPIEIEEDGQTFEENSYKKAKSIMELCGKITLADDSGLMVDALGGEPGVYSSRYAGDEATDQKNNEKLLSALGEVDYQQRGAKFVSVITMVFPDGKVITARGECKGKIGMTPEGNQGFGYDPLFIPDGYEETFAQLGDDTKNQISHRAQALIELEKKLQEII